MAGSRQFSVLSGNEIVKCQGHVCLIMKTGNQFGSLFKCTKSSMWGLGSTELVWGLGYQLEKSDEVVTADFSGFEFEVMDDEVRAINEKLDSSCWPAYNGICNRFMTLLTGWPVGENEETYIDGLDANNIQTDTATQPMWAIAVFRVMMLTFIPLWVERYKCDSSLQQFDFWSLWCFGLKIVPHYWWRSSQRRTITFETVV